MRSFGRSTVAAALLASMAWGAHAGVTISSDATQNMVCSQGVCAPTAQNAVLNAGDVETMLASGDVEVTTTGSDVQAKDIAVSSAVTWNGSSTLALKAYHAITVGAAIAVAGPGGVNVVSGHGGAISYNGGNIAFSDLGSSLTMNGKIFVLVADIKGLAADIKSHRQGRFALANSYDASADGTYTSDPIETPFGGVFDGLGNAISNLSINNQSDTNVGLFNSVVAGGTLRNLNIANADVSFATSFGAILAGLNGGTIAGCSTGGEMNAPGAQYEYAGGMVGDNSGEIDGSYSTASVSGYITGGLAGGNTGTINASFATGSVSSTYLAGGLVGFDEGVIFYSHATGATQASGALLGQAQAGGLAGLEAGWIAESYASGSVTVTDSASATFVGGLVGEERGTVQNSYATGDVSGADGASIGGFAGCLDCNLNSATILSSYSTGRISRLKTGNAGGFVGVDGTFAGISKSYWDITTSHARQGTGNRGNEPGLTGVSTKQLRARLPHGFSRLIWGENDAINNGLPYLLNNPPPQ